MIPACLDSRAHLDSNPLYHHIYRKHDEDRPVDLFKTLRNESFHVKFSELHMLEILLVMADDRVKSSIVEGTLHTFQKAQRAIIC